MDDGRRTMDTSSQSILRRLRTHRPSSVIPSRLYTSRADWLALALYVVMTIVFTWPLATNFGNAILGDGNDGWQVVWDLWWMDQAISTGSHPYHFTSVYSPWGTTNYLHLLNPLWGLLTLPVQWVSGPIAAYNLSCWLSLIMLAFAGYLLGRDVTGSRLAGFVAGLGIAYSPHQMAQYLGHLDVGSMQYSVLAVWCLYRALAPSVSRRAALVWLLWTGALLAMSALSHPYALIFALLCMLLLALYRSMVNALLPCREWWQPTLKTGVAMSIGLLVASPFLIAMAKQLRGPDAPRHTGGLAAGDLGEVEFFSADLAAYALPAPFHPLWGEVGRQALDSTGGVLVDRTASLGYILITLAMIGVFAPKTRSRAAFWAVLALMGLVLSLGPVLHLAGTDTGISSPAAFVWSLPNATFLRVPARFATIVTLGVAVCAALGITVLMRWARTMNGKRAIAGLACLAIAAEFLPAPYPTSQWNIDPWFTSSDRANDTGSLLVIPFFAGSVQPLQWQVASGLPLVGGYLSRRPVYPLTDGIPPFADVGLNRDAFLPLFRRSADTLCKPLPDSATYLDILRLAGVRYVAVDTTYVARADPRVLAAKRIFPAPPTYSNGPLTIYDTGGGDASPSLFGLVEDTEDWLPVEEGSFRWTAQNHVRFHAWSGAERTAQLHLKLAGFAQDRNVTISAGGVALATGSARIEGDTFDLEWQVPKGFSTVVVTAEGEPVTPASLGTGNDRRPLVMRLLECSYSTR